MFPTIWLLTFPQSLRASELRLRAGECYGYRVPPVLGGDYHGDNRVPISAREHLGFCGYIQNQIKELPDGTQVKLKWTD